MLWLLGAICILLCLLVIGVYLVHKGVIHLVDRADAMLVHLDAIHNEAHSAQTLPALIGELSQDLRIRARTLDHQLEDIPRILRHVMALRELTYGRRGTEHDTLREWPSVSPIEDRIKLYDEKRSAHKSSAKTNQTGENGAEP